MTKLLTPAEVAQERVQAMARVFTRVNRVLTGEDIDCAVEDNPAMHAPAWSDGRTVTFNTAHIGSVTNTEDIIKITGLNYHELSHVMFTPRAKTSLREKVINGGLAGVFNMLEDQRIETLMTALYPATKPYFTTTFMKYCLADHSQWTTVHVLAHGRRYLPESVRNEFEGRYERQQDVAEINRIIDEYRLLTFPSDFDRAYELLQEFAMLMGNITPPSDPNGHNAGRPEVEKGRPLKQGEQDDAKEWAEFYDDEDEDGDEDDDDSEAGSGDGDDEDDSSSEDGDFGGDGDETDEEGEDEGKGSAKGEGDGDEDGDADGEDGDSDDDSEAKSSSHGSGAGSGDEQASEDDLRKMMEDIVNKVESSKQVQDEVKQKQSSIVAGDGEHMRTLPRSRYRYVDVDPMISMVSKKFARELERIRADLDPGWQRHQASGRLNIGRAMNADELDLDTVWDRWEEGHNDRADIEAVLFVDSSSSMTHVDMEQACTAAWAIKRAIESINGIVTVLSFNTTCSQLFDKNEKADFGLYRFQASSGGTDPSAAIKESYRIFQASKQHTKIAIFVSDGGWMRGDDMVTRLNDAGVVTAHATIQPYTHPGYEPETHNCQVAETIATATDLIPFARRVVTQVMKGMK